MSETNVNTLVINTLTKAQYDSSSKSATELWLCSDETMPVALNTTVTLTSGGWSNNTQTVSVTGVKSTGIVFVNPAPASLADYAAGQVYCSAQADNSLTFTCLSTPSNNLTVTIVML